MIHGLQLRTACAVFSLLTVGLGLAGCGGSEDAGPQRYRIEGTVTFEGKPVAIGKILFTPDNSQGNMGPGAVADIKDGKYETAKGAGVVGGPHLVQITGFDGIIPPGVPAPFGTELFKPQTLKEELPKKDATVDLVVPGKKKK
ncbi:hypothetical protein SH668x_001176 [Planctomicrobium sp. SH668]|uniref:hypothetical protein n=1 Tax=Planctomicrobium sp. SH668 TaxID=3448126 RepID=UPI003F5B6803